MHVFRIIPRMIQLTPDESRVLGVLIEKAFTTPDQYPLTLNAVVNGSNQKNNRDPVTTLDDTRAFDALEGLRGKGLVVRADMAGSRVNKFKHQTGDTLHVRPAEVALLAELLLRGPQTLGELRGRASRMQPFESIEAVKNMLGALMSREEPLVKELPPAPGSRAGCSALRRSSRRNSCGPENRTANWSGHRTRDDRRPLLFASGPTPRPCIRVSSRLGRWQ